MNICSLINRLFGFGVTEPNPEPKFVDPHPEKGKFIRNYKGFRSRVNESFDCQNAFYVREDGRELCVGQTDDIVSTAEHFIRRPLPESMTGKPAEYSPYYDAEHVKRTCAHGVSLNDDCHWCIEHYGTARAL